ncbi:four-helix bundle copper-binding protein [Halomicrococcus gelatinilyticus]|uniref:four-helix bundle copper-binding protein n=1 Tax=Halomicrococcus gelatinilyticus TaxID=1702103 RepID=UPI002E132D19
MTRRGSTRQLGDGGESQPNPHRYGPRQREQRGERAPVGGTVIGFEQRLPEELRNALAAFERAANVSEWCANQGLDDGPQLARVVQLCGDVADVATLNARLIARDSEFGPQFAELFARTAEECADECLRHPQQYTQECAAVLSRAVDTTYRMLDALRSRRAGRTGSVRA